VQYNNAGALGGISGFTTDGTRVTASTTIAVGGATPSTSGAGITFPSTQSQSSDVNTLDDYEEGTWTPVIEGSTSAGTATYTGQTGRYTKIGRQVVVTCVLYWNSGTGTGNLKFSGLPFRDSLTLFEAMVTTQSSLTVPANSYVTISANAVNTNGAFFWSTAVGGGNTTLLAYDAAAAVQFTATYFTTD
jgi:hypothetical protein